MDHKAKDGGSSVARTRPSSDEALSGDWTLNGGDSSVGVSYHVTAAGSAVVETLFPGTPHEMVSVYTRMGTR